MMTKQSKEDALNLSYARIIACDKANEILELYKKGKRSSRYDDRVFDHLDQCDGKGTFFLSSEIDRYVQTEETKSEKRDNNPYFLLYLDEVPVCLIRSGASEDPDQKWEYYDYPIKDARCFDLIGSERFCILNASNYGLYLIAENDYYALSPSPFEEEDFFEQVKKLNLISDNKGIEKHELDLDLIKDLNVSVKDYDYTPSEADLSLIRKYMKESTEEIDGCRLIGPVPLYQYGFISANEIEVRDIDRENGALLFKIVRDGKVIGYVHYDPYDEGSDTQIFSEANEADKTEKDIQKYYACLSPLGYVFKDRIVEETADDPDYSLIDRMVAEKIRMKIREKEPGFGVYPLNE